MLAVLSPAKSLDYESKLPTRKHTEPRLLAEAEQLIDVMRTKSPDEVADLMGISDDLATLNVERYADFETPFTMRNARQALLAFNGDVYQGIAAAQRFDGRDFAEAQKTLRILSGLYGVLRPLDLMQPYRLEMGIQVANPGGKNLYEFWGSRIAQTLAEDLQSSPGADVLVNLASNEYFSSVDVAALEAAVPGVQLISPRFEDEDARGNYRVISFFAKRARGEMAAWLIKHRVRTPGALKKFDGAGYAYAPEVSSKTVPVFRRARQ